MVNKDDKVPVLHLAMSLDIGGAETHIVGLARCLKSKGWPIYVASFGGRRVRDLDASDIRHFTVPLHSRWPHRMWEAGRKVSSLISDWDIGLVHAHARIPAWLADKICARERVPLVTTYHWTFVSGPFWNLVTKPGDATVAVSQDIKDYVIRSFGFDPCKVTVIPNGIDTDLYSVPTQEDIGRARDSFQVPADRGPVLVYASRMNKDLSQTAVSVVEAAASLLPKYPEMTLIVAGDGEYLESVRRKARETNKNAGRNAVICPGFVLDTVPLFQAADLVLGMSRVVLEGMSAGKPAIVTGPGGTFGPVTQKILGQLEERNFTSRGAPEPTNAHVLAGYIDSLLCDSAEMKRLGLLGRNIVLDAHSMEIVAGKVERVYLKLLGQGR